MLANSNNNKKFNDTKKIIQTFWISVVFFALKSSIIIELEGNYRS